jgi:cation transport regulator ChaB
MKELIEIQSRLHAPKDNRNDFGKYNYRSAEDILENVKPILKEVKCTLILEDEIIMVADRIYVKATARLQNSAGEVEEASAFAREEETKKGYDAAQITGSASSYARKYALNGLFCIDDTKDPDATNTHGKETTELDDILAEIRSAKNENELKTAWNKYKDKDKHYSNKIKAVVNEMGDKLGLTKK